MNEPLWKTVLNWGAVIVFFILPIGMLIVHVYALTHPGWVSKPLSGKEEYDFNYLFSLQRDTTFLVIGLAGLKTWEVIKNGRQNNTNE